MNSQDWPYLVEPMRPEDIPAVMVIERMVYSRPWPAEAYRYELAENPKSHYYVARLKDYRPRREAGLKGALKRAFGSAESDESLLGYGGLWLMVDEAHVSTLAVHSDWQGRGVGALLLATLIDKAVELQAAFVTLEVRVSNLRAQTLYERYGFRRVGVRRKYYSDNNEDAFIMSTEAIDSPGYLANLEALRAGLDARLRASPARKEE